MTNPIHKTLVAAVVALSVLLGAQSAQAAFIPVGPSGSGAIAGLNATWIQVNAANNPNSLAEANAIISAGSGAPGFIQQVVTMPTTIDFTDEFNNAGLIAGFTSDPLADGAIYAVEYAGFIDITTSGTYTFRMRHDDGFNLTIGGMTVMEFVNDTAPLTTTATVTLSAGLYDFSLVSWEQGGQFINELSSHLGSAPFALTDNFFKTAAPVPEPGTLAMFGLGLAGLGFMRRRRAI